MSEAKQKKRYPDKRDGMARSRKNRDFPREIQAPGSLVPLMQAFHVDSDNAAKSLIQTAVNAIYKKSQYNPVSEEELEGVIALMRGISPKDTLETLYAAQIVACHMLGMRKLTEQFNEDERLGLNLLRFSSEAMQQLERKRSGGAQNIVVNYNYTTQNAVISQPLLPVEEV